MHVRLLIQKVITMLMQPKLKQLLKILIVVVALQHLTGNTTTLKDSGESNDKKSSTAISIALHNNLAAIPQWQVNM